MTTAKTYTINGVSLEIEDDPQSIAARAVVGELKRGEYGLDKIDFAPGDVVLDIGAHVGIVSIYLAKKYPFLRIIAYEPMPVNFERLQRNVKSNGVQNIAGRSMGVSRDGRQIEMTIHRGNTGGATTWMKELYLADHTVYKAPTMMLDEILDQEGIFEKLKLLKMDIEGMEHEVLMGTDVLPLVDYLGIEMHTNKRLVQQGYTIQELWTHLLTFFPEDHISFTAMRMAE